MERHKIIIERLHMLNMIDKIRQMFDLPRYSLLTKAHYLFLIKRREPDTIQGQEVVLWVKGGTSSLLGFVLLFVSEIFAFPGIVFCSI